MGVAFFPGCFHSTATALPSQQAHVSARPDPEKPVPCSTMTTQPSARIFLTPLDRMADSSTVVTRSPLRASRRTCESAPRLSRQKTQPVQQREPPLERPSERPPWVPLRSSRSEEHTSELQSQSNLVCRLLLEKN